jgi:LAS superfamily LD-carboxypeptidase LdcB
VPVPDVASVDVPVADGTCGPPSLLGEANGFLPASTLCPLSTGRGHRLRTDAARAFERLQATYASSLGRPMCVTDSYRSYAAQVDVFARKPSLAAVPGTSQHGWGLALDLCGGVQLFGSQAHEWMRANAPAFGWHHPQWARQGGRKPEPWHWEYDGGDRQPGR